MGDDRVIIRVTNDSTVNPAKSEKRCRKRAAVIFIVYHFTGKRNYFAVGVRGHKSPGKRSVGALQHRIVRNIVLPDIACGLQRKKCLFAGQLTAAGKADSGSRQNAGKQSFMFQMHRLPFGF